MVSVPQNEGGQLFLPLGRKILREVVCVFLHVPDVESLVENQQPDLIAGIQKFRGRGIVCHAERHKAIVLMEQNLSIFAVVICSRSDDPVIMVDAAAFQLYCFSV